MILSGFQGLDKDAPQQLKTDGIKVNSVSEPCEVHGYNHATRLPRMGAIAIRRGSEAQISGQQANDWWQALQALRASGLGERTFEGFGQFMLFEEKVFQIRDQSDRNGSKVEENKDEVRRAKVAFLLSVHKHLISALEVGRWQDLRNKALAENKVGAALKTWFRQAERAVLSREQKSSEKIGELEAALLVKPIDVSLIHDFALQAAKRKQSQKAAGGSQ